MQESAEKRRGRRSAADSLETRNALLAAAGAVFAEQGLNGARLDRIADQAGVTTGAIYNHFDGREDLLVQACRSALKTLRLSQLAAEAPDLLHYVNESADALLAADGKAARMLNLEVHLSAARSEPIADLITEWHAEAFETLRDRLPPGAGSPEAVFTVLHLLLIGVSMIDAFASSNADRAEVLSLVNRLAASLLDA